MPLSPYISQPVMLSSVERMAFYLSVDPGKGRVDGKNNDSAAQQATRRQIIQWATSISTSFEDYLSRQILIAERIEYFDVPGNGQSFFVRGVPILTDRLLTDSDAFMEVQNDPTGQFTGSQWTLTPGTDYYIGETGTYVRIWVNLLIGGSRFLKIRYIGGMVDHPVISRCTTVDEDEADEIKANRFVYGETSESQGRVVSFSGHTLEIENIVGLFHPGEKLKFQTTLDGQDITDCEATLASIDRPSLVQQFPDLDQALLIELRYMQKHQMDFENTSSGGPGGSTYRHTFGDRKPVIFQPETLAILNRYRRMLVGN